MENWGRYFLVKSGPFLNAGCIMYSISIFNFTFYLSINQSFLIQARRPITDTHDTTDLQTTNIKRKKETTKLLTTYTIHK